MNVLLLFLDGVGLGTADLATNPLAGVGDGFRRLSAGCDWVRDAPGVVEDRAVFRPIDACLGVDGLPQSGTGQATLFTGVNCAAVAGRHYGPLAPTVLRPLLAAGSLFRRVVDRFGPDSAVFANAFPPRYFEAAAPRDRWPVISRCAREAGLRLRDLDDLAADRAVAADVTGAGLARFVPGVVAERTVEYAADTLLSLASRARFTVFEVFHTDKAGHEQSAGLARAILEPLDALFSCLTAGKPDDLLVVCTSDHGNLEDLSVRTHTRNEVPLAASGPGARRFAAVTDLAGVAPAILDTLSIASSPD